MNPNLSPEAREAIADRTPLKPPLSFQPSNKIRSTNFAVRGGKLLSDKKILQYMKEGRYGTQMQALALGQKVKGTRRGKPQMSAEELLRKMRAQLGL